MTRHPTPTRHGNWHVVNGELVDLDATPPTAQPDADRPDDPAPASIEIPSGSTARKRRRNDTSNEN